MNASRTPNRRTSRWLWACVPLCAVALLALGVAYADNRGQDDQDCEARGRSLREMVDAGELTREQAGERYNAACGERGNERSE